jgi:hypothetical protein
MNEVLRVRRSGCDQGETGTMFLLELSSKTTPEAEDGGPMYVRDGQGDHLEMEEGVWGEGGWGGRRWETLESSRCS